MAKSAFEQTGVDLPDPEPVQARPEPVEEPDRPAWLPSKFKDEQAFAESYGELERRFYELSREKQEAEEYAAAMAEQLEAQEEQYQQPQEQALNPLAAQYQQAYEMGDVQTMLAVQAYMANQIAEEKVKAIQQSQPQEDPVQQELWAHYTDSVAKEAFEKKYGESWDTIKQDVGQYIQGHMYLLNGAETPAQAASRLVEAADYVRATRGVDQGAVGNPAADVNRGKFLGQTLTGHGARTQASQDAAQDLVERMKGLSRPYGYSS